MQEQLRRYFKMVIGCLGAVVSAAAIVSALHNGRIAGLGRMSLITGGGATASAPSSSFGFMLFFHAVACVGFAWLAWSAWRD